MVVVVLGFHKSGTTLVARTLEESGINMGANCQGNYPKCKYEDPRVAQILRDILYGGQKRRSVDLPWTYEDKSEAIRAYVRLRQTEDGKEWGFKVPDITLCYEMWRRVMPPHCAIGVTRSLHGVLSYYEKRRTPYEPGRIRWARHMYLTMMQSYHVPIIAFEDILKKGPAVIEKAIGKIVLADVRDGRKHE